MEIIVGYGVGPQMKRIPRHYWDHLSMVYRLGCYYSTLFKFHLGVTQGLPLTPAIFKILVDALIRHWFTLVTWD